MAGKREENLAGSSNTLRGDVLGVLKVATVEQIQQIAAPHLSYRHTDKPTPSKRKQARTASHTGALSDLRKHGLAENGGQLPGGDTLRNLTPMGLTAAARELGGRWGRWATRPAARAAPAPPTRWRSTRPCSPCCARSRTCPSSPTSRPTSSPPHRPPSTRPPGWAP